jgi:CubicO group peptidase (beta-lactamase class C family)
VKYTDAGTILLGFMLEELLGKSATIIFQEEVLKPIGMTNSQFPPLTANRIVPTQQLADGTVIKGITHDPKARILGEHAGNAGLFTTIDDIHLFMRTYFEGSYLKSATIEWLLQDHTLCKTGSGH